MRRVVVLLTTFLCLLASAACGALDEDSNTGSVEVSGEFGVEPKVETKGDYSLSSLETKVLTKGDGEKIAMGDGVFTQLLVVNGYDGETSLSSWENGNKEFLELGDTLPGLSKALAGNTVGSRVLIEAPAREIFGEYGQPELFISPEDPLVIVADIVSKTLTEISTDPADQEEGSPKIVFKDGTPASFDFSAGPEKAPAKPTLVTLKEGEGPALTTDSTLAIRYLGQVYGGEEPFDTNYDGAISATPLTGLVPGFAELMPGVTVGSRVLLILPPAFGYGEAGNPQAGIEPTDTLVFVVDVLGAVESSEPSSGATDKATEEPTGVEE